MRRLIVALLELFRLAAGWLIVGYVLYTLAVGFVNGNIGGALIQVGIGIAVFLVLAVLYSIGMTWATGERFFGSRG